MANKRTKKVGSAGRFGSRYGVKIRKKVLKIEEKQKQNHTCPNCSKKTLKREVAGMYKCDSCSLTIAGGAYYPETMTGKVRLKEKLKTIKGGGFQMPYKCVKCKIILDELPKVAIACPECAAKILIKTRSDVAKTIKAI